MDRRQEIDQDMELVAEAMELLKAVNKLDAEWHQEKASNGSREALAEKGQALIDCLMGTERELIDALVKVTSPALSELRLADRKAKLN